MKHAGAGLCLATFAFIARHPWPGPPREGRAVEMVLCQKRKLYERVTRLDPHVFGGLLGRRPRV